MAIVTGDRYLENLGTFIDRHAEQLVEGTLTLKLNPVGLLYLDSRLAALKELEELRNNAPVDYLRAYVADLGDYRKLEKLRRFLLLLESVKVVSLIKGERDPTPLSLLPFGRLRVLELRGCDLSTCSPRGLLELRPHLETIICLNSANALRHIFLEGTVDVPPVPWVCLENVLCANNGFTIMDEAIRVLPAVETLDLSRNCFTKVSNLEQCTRLKMLDLGFNHITAVDSLGPSLRNLQELVLRGNALASTRGLEVLSALEKLDIGHNLLGTLHEVSRLRSLSHLSHLWLDSNPLVYLPKYRAQVFGQFVEPFKMVLDGKRMTGCEKLAVKRFIRARLYEHRDSSIHVVPSAESQGNIYTAAAPAPLVSEPPTSTLDSEKGETTDNKTKKGGAIEDLGEGHATWYESAPADFQESTSTSTFVSTGGLGVSSDPGPFPPHVFLRSRSNSDDETASSVQSDELTDVSEGQSANHKHRSDRGWLPSKARALADGFRNLPSPALCLNADQSVLPSGPLAAPTGGQLKKIVQQTIGRPHWVPSDRRFKDQDRPLLVSLPLDLAEMDSLAETPYDDVESLDGANLAELLQSRSVPSRTPPHYEHALLGLRQDLEAELLQVGSSARRQRPPSEDSSSDSTSVDWSESDSSPSNPCSPRADAGTTIGRLMSDFQARLTPGEAKLRSPSVDVRKGNLRRRHLRVDVQGEALEDENSSGDTSHGSSAGRWHLGQAAPDSLLTSDLEQGPATWRASRRFHDYRPVQGPLDLPGVEPIPSLYSDDAMATAGGGPHDSRRTMRRVKWSGRPAAEEDENSDGRVTARSPWQNSSLMGPVLAGHGSLSENVQLRPSLSGSFGRRKATPGALSGTSLARDTLSEERAQEDELEICFRRTVGDQKSEERSTGYLRCGCLRVWKDELEESKATLLFSSDSKWYVMREEVMQSPLTHRQGLVLRVLASHKVTDVKRIVVGLGLHVLRIHAGAASEYVFVTRRAASTADLLQRLAGPASQVGVESWGAEQLRRMEGELFDGRKPNVRLYAMLHYRTDSGGRWTAASLIMTAGTLVLCKEQLHSFAASLVGPTSNTARTGGGSYFVLETRRAIRDLRKIVVQLPNRMDHRHLSLVFLAVPPETPSAADNSQSVADTSVHGSSFNGSTPGGSKQDERQELTVWELRFPTDAILQKVLPLLRAAWAECKEIAGEGIVG